MTRAAAFQPRQDDEPLAVHLHANAELIGADRAQRARLAYAASLAQPHRPAADRAEAGRIAASVRDELKANLEAVYEAQARGEASEPFNDDGARFIKSRDGLCSLVRSGALSEGEGETGLVLRRLGEAAGPASVGSQLGRLGEVGGAASSSDARVRHGLRQAYAAERLSQALAAVGCDMGRRLLVAVAIEGQTLRSLGGAGKRQKGLTLALKTALQRAAASLAKTGGLRIGER